MSIPVQIEDLATALSVVGAGYLVSTDPTNGGGAVKVVTVEPAYVDGVLRVAGPGRGTLRNVGANAAVTLVFPPAEPRGYTLLVDGEAVTEGEDVRLTPRTAVWHRPPSHADGPGLPAAAAEVAGEQTSCGADCRPAG